MRRVTVIFFSRDKGKKAKKNKKNECRATLELKLKITNDATPRTPMAAPGA